MRVTPVGRTALWIGVGGFIGLAVGGLLTNADRAGDLIGLWLLLLALYVGVVFVLAREKGPRAPKPQKARSIAVSQPEPGASAADRLDVAFELLDIPAGFPAVMGRGEPVQVRVTVRRAGQPADTAGSRSDLSAANAAEGAAVQLTATMDGESLTGDGLTGTEGAVEFTLEPEGAGELRLHADAKIGRHAGEGVGTVSIVNYDEEIARLFSEFRAFAISTLGADAHTDTARELCDKLRTRADPQSARALLELARVYELVAYGERDADRRLYLAVMQQLMVLEHADMPAPSGVGAIRREA